MLEQRIKAAQAANDLGTILRLMAESAQLTPQDFIKKTVGSLLYVYYVYINHLHVRPKDLDDLIDGLLFIEAQNYVDERALKTKVT